MYKYTLVYLARFVSQPGEHTEPPGGVGIVRVRYGQLDKFHSENIQEPVGTAVGHGQGTRDTRTGPAGKVSRDRLLVPGESDAVVAIQSDENVAGAVGQGNRGRDEKAPGTQTTRNEIIGEDPQG